MRVVVTLLRKHLLESRWLLGLSATAFLGLSALTTWLAGRFERLVDGGDVERITRGVRVFRFLGGPEMDGSTTALEVCWWNHPVIVLTVLGWAVARGSALAGEIERGTVDLTLSRPVTRSAYLTSHLLFTLFGLLVLATALVVGNRVGNLAFVTKAPPSFWVLLRPSAMVVSLGAAVYGYTLPFSSVDVVRWRAMVAGAAVTLGGLIGMSLAPQFEGYDWLGKLSVFHLYAPVTVAMKGEPLAFNAVTLGLVFAAGVALSFGLFARRDIPSNS